MKYPLFCFDKSAFIDSDYVSDITSAAMMQVLFILLRHGVDKLR